jgi:hypothetical protein
VAQRYGPDAVPTIELVDEATVRLTMRFAEALPPRWLAEFATELTAGCCSEPVVTPACGRHEGCALTVDFPIEAVGRALTELGHAFRRANRQQRLDDQRLEDLRGWLDRWWQQLIVTP